MKKKYWLFISAVLLICISFLASRYFIYDEYELPFKAEDVRSVAISNIWGYKIVENTPELEWLISEFNKIKTIPNDIPSQYQVADGAIGYVYYFELKDGRQLEYSTAEIKTGGIYFADENRKNYTARDFPQEAIWNQLDAEKSPRNVYAICYQGQIHKGTAAMMKVPEDAQLVGTITGITGSPDSELECSSGKTGQKVYVWHENGTDIIGIEIEQEVYPELYAFTIDLV